MAYLDDWYSTLAKNLKAGSTKRFFWKGYEGAPGEMKRRPRCSRMCWTRSQEG